MTEKTYLEQHPPEIRQFRRPRRAKPSGVVVVHTAESAPDTTGPDTGAENVANFIRTRTTYGSYHDLADSDSIVHLVPYDAEAYGDGTGSNPHAYHVSAATQAAKWPSLSRGWREATVRNMARAAARYARWLKAEHGITIPARCITRAESEKKTPGFISHGERDPGRRSDPGKDFPWQLFLSEYARELSPEPLKKIGVVAREVIAGRWGNGQERIDRLTAAGYDAKKVQARVDKLMRPKPPAPTLDARIVVAASRYDRSPASLVKSLEAHRDRDKMSVGLLTELERGPRYHAAARIEGLALSKGIGLGNADDSAIIFRADEWERLYEGSHRVSGETRYEGRPPLYTRLVVIRYKPTGFVLAASMTHLASSAESDMKAGRYELPRPKDWLKTFRESKKVLNRIAKKYGADARIYGADFNLDVKKQWVRDLLEKEAPKYRISVQPPFPGGGTLGSRWIDFFLYRGNLTVPSVRLLPDDDSSDHRPSLSRVVA